MTISKPHAILTGIVFLAVLFVGGAWLKAHDAWMRFEAREAGRQEKISANKEADKALQQKEVKATVSNQQIDSDLARKLSDLKKQAGNHPTTEQTAKMIQESIAGLTVTQTKDDKGQPFISVPDTQENRDAINQADAAFKSCRFSLDACQQKQQNFLDMMASKDERLALRDDTIKQQAETIKELKKLGKGGNIFSRTLRVAVPVACAAGGAYFAGKNGKNSAAGAVIGGTGCMLAFKF